MTCIAAIVERGKFYLGADSMVAAGDLVIVSRDPKVWQAGPCVVGICGHAAWWELLRDRVEWDRVARCESEREFRRELLDEIRARATSVGIDLRDDGEGDDDPVAGQALIGVGGALYLADHYLTVSRVAEPFAAIGSGSGPALGVLYATAGQPVRQRLKTALQAAERYTTNVRHPWRWAETG
jgi:ATP-dependent protease HslVU (ClpYQ) peptidase subunit